MSNGMHDGGHGNHVVELAFSEIDEIVKDSS
jgi:hypothetical protein